MSIHNILVPNNLPCLYINEVCSDVDFHQNVHIDGNLVVDGTIEGSMSPSHITPGPVGSFIKTSAPGVVSWQQFTATDIPSGANGDYLRTIGSTVQWAPLGPITIPAIKNSSLRAGVDPSASPGILGGLVIPQGSPQFNMPLIIADQGLGIANPYLQNDNNDFTVNADTITINHSGKYSISFIVSIFGNIQKVSVSAVQVLLNGQSIFGAPPLCSDGSLEGIVVTSIPAPFNYAWFYESSANGNIPAGSEIALCILPQNPLETNEIALTSSISITRIDTEGYQGATGATGMQGATGVNIGPTGASGVQGPTGVIGQQGATGVQGPTGPGPQGDTGPTGATGIDGPTGATGPTGDTGATGPQGNDGSQGATGPMGNDGQTGATGATGVAGNVYSVNNTGSGNTPLVQNPGPNTDIYLKELQGGSNITLVDNGNYISIISSGGGPPTDVENGSGGSNVWVQSPGSNPVYVKSWYSGDGSVYVASDFGSYIDLRANGPMGPTGATGPAGANGADGATGATGVDGATGATGVDGATGATGVDGATGATGPVGATGAGGVVASSFKNVTPVAVSNATGDLQTLTFPAGTFTSAAVGDSFILTSFGNWNGGPGAESLIMRIRTNGVNRFITPTMNFSGVGLSSNGAYRITFEQVVTAVASPNYTVQVSVLITVLDTDSAATNTSFCWTGQTQTTLTLASALVFSTNVTATNLGVTNRVTKAVIVN